MKAEALLKRINEDMATLQGMAKSLPKADRDSLGSIVTSFGTFEKSLQDEVTEPKVEKTTGQMDVNASSGSEQLRI